MCSLWLMFSAHSQEENIVCLFFKKHSSKSSGCFQSLIRYRVTTNKIHKILRKLKLASSFWQLSILHITLLQLFGSVYTWTTPNLNYLPLQLTGIVTCSCFLQPPLYPNGTSSVPLLYLYSSLSTLLQA